MVTRIDVGRPEHEQLFNLAAGIKELNDEMISLGGNPTVVVGKDGTLCLVDGENRLIPAREDALAARVRSHCEPGKYKTETDSSGASALVWVEQPSIPRPILKAYMAGGMWPGVPRVRHVVTAPLIRPDFTTCWDAGWDEATACWVLPGIKPDPSLLGKDPRDFFDQFALTDRRQVADCLAAALTPLLSTALSGALPGFIATAHNPGSGKSELSSLISRMAGHEPKVTRWPGADELNKTVSAYVATDAPIVVFDNVKRDVDSPDLESVITSRTTSYRVMRTHQTVDMASNTTWHMTVNNATVSQDLQRRCIVVDLDTKNSPSPIRWDGSVVGWGKANRAALVTLMCSLIGAWRDAGAVPGSVAHPGFEEWSQTVSGILECAGVGGMWEAREDVIAGAVSNEADNYQEILERIYAITASAEFTATTLWEKIADPLSGEPVLRDFLKSMSATGNALAKMQGSEGSYSITRRRSGGTKWKVTWDHAVAA